MMSDIYKDNFWLTLTIAWWLALP